MTTPWVKLLRIFSTFSSRARWLQYGTKYCRKVQLCERCTNVTDRQITDGIAMPIVERNVVTFGEKYDRPTPNKTESFRIFGGKFGIRTPLIYKPAI